jgi:hypothetical protein
MVITIKCDTLTAVLQTCLLIPMYKNKKNNAIPVNDKNEAVCLIINEENKKLSSAF